MSAQGGDLRMRKQAQGAGRPVSPNTAAGEPQLGSAPADPGWPKSPVATALKGRAGAALLMVFFFAGLFFWNHKVALALIFLLLEYEIGVGLVHSRSVKGTVASAVLAAWMAACVWAMLQVLDDHGFENCAWICVIAATCDSAQYYVGKNMGRTRAFPWSPKKTLEGYVGGMLAAALATVFVAPTVPPSLALGMTFVCCAGDAMCSIWKRIVGIKDASNIFASHGGALDRFDAQAALQLFVWVYMDGVLPTIRERGVYLIGFWIVFAALSTLITMCSGRKA